VIAELLDRCPGAAALVTSRRPLRLRGEQQINVAPLPVPPDGGRRAAGSAALEAIIEAPAVRLFEERARGVRSDFVVDASNAQAVAALVQHLDGLPLAIELAAARTRILEPAQMLERLERGAAVSMSAGADFPERQRTLRATLEWRHALLTPAQQTLLARLSVFADGATLEGIEAVCSGGPIDDLLDDLSTLLDDGFLLTQRGSDGGQPRACCTACHGLQFFAPMRSRRGAQR
jgi:predicted ATPase